MSDSPQPPAPLPGPLPEPEPTGYDEHGVPTFDHVRDRIEGRYATVMGTTELAEDSAAGRTLAEQQADHDAAAREKLEQLRRSVRGE